MAKKTVRRKTSKSVSKYKPFELHGNHETKTVLVYSVCAFGAGLVAGYFLQPYLASMIMSFVK